ncbi:hypothetical protein LOD99_15416 [Oopsacas minuta]|uniref:Uncharacterized protein n=1 Tax=Oopsacas minuta TaxID=111878 RepID=A0AAV7KBQ6_9METZ|nr:hypothetical protein LOD99_15416 [Oopsacas minuta]
MATNISTPEIAPVTSPPVLPSIPSNSTPPETKKKREISWNHQFHHQFLSLNFAGYLIREDWEDKIDHFMKKERITQILTGPQDREKFKEIIKEFDNLQGFDKFTEVIGSYELFDRDSKKEFYEEKCRKDIISEYTRYASLWDKDISEYRDEYYTSVENILARDAPPPDNIPGDKLEAEINRRVERELERGFRIMFGRRDHHLVASLVEALWDMEGEKEIRIAFVPKEQLLSVDMEYRKSRELTLQLHPNKPVYKRRDRDEIRGFEEAFTGGMPWCRAPGARQLAKSINDDVYKQITGNDNVETIWIEDKWLMSERKRLYREERKKDKDITPVKETDRNDQVNHYFPILKNISGFSGYIRDENFYEGLKGIIYIIQVDKIEESQSDDILTHFEELTKQELKYRKTNRKYKHEKHEQKLTEEKIKSDAKTA